MGTVKRAVITGGTGFVGANLARRLVADGHEVHLLVRPSHTRWRIEELLGDVRLHLVDLTDAVGTARAIEAAQPQWVFHLAAHGAYSWQRDARAMVEINLLGTTNLAEACLRTGFEAFINAGTSSEYGWRDHAPTEDERVEPNSYYAVTKASASLLCSHVAREHQARIATLRLYSVFGPYEEPGRLMPTLVTHILRGMLPPLANPDTVRDYIYVDDVCDAFVSAAACPEWAPGSVFNIGTGVQTSLRDLVSLACEVVKVCAEPEWGSMPGRPWDTSTWVADSVKARHELGWAPCFSLRQGLSAMVHWFRTRPAEARGWYPGPAAMGGANARR